MKTHDNRELVFKLLFKNCQKKRLVTEAEIGHRYFRDMQVVNTHLKMLNVLHH